MNQQIFQSKFSKVTYIFSLLMVLISTFFSKPLYSLEYGLFAKNENSKPITKLFVMSERCSGSNFMNSLALQNFQLQDERLGQKHFAPWYDLPLVVYTGNPSYYTFEGTEDFLFIIIFRNAYDWARSLHQKPFHADKSLFNIPFSQFIRMPWTLNPKNKTAKKQRKLNPFVDLNPVNGLPFENIFGLRNAKIKNMLQIMNLAPNVYYINYETVRDHPQEVLEEIKSLFLVTANASYIPVDSYKGRGEEIYKPKQYDPLSIEDLYYINFYLDSSLENQIGYQLIDNLEIINKH